MASRYWVSGGTGNWNSTTNWAATSGGASGASFPIVTDDVFIDALSGTSPSITVNVTSACLSLDFTGAITPTFAGSSALSIAGNLTRIATITWNYTGTISFTSTSTGKTVTSAGGTFKGLLQFSGAGGGWTLQDTLISTGQIVVASGSFASGNQNITCVGFNMSGSGVRSVSLGSSTLTTSDTLQASIVTNLTFTPGTSTIVCVPPDGIFFFGGGLTYNNVTFTGTPTTVTGSNTFNTLTFTAGKTVSLTSSTNQTYTSLVALGTPASKITIQSTSAGSAATMTRTSGNQVIRNVTLKDITATGGATFYALGTTSVSGNTGWTFQMLIKQEKVSGTMMALYHIDSNGVMQKVSG